MTALHPYAEDYCEHDEIDHLCGICQAQQQGEPIRNGVVWSSLIADIDTLLAEEALR